MTGSDLASHAEAFRAAVTAHNPSLAQTALQQYIMCFRSYSRTLAEIEDAKNLLQWGIEATKTHKVQLAEDLMLLKCAFDAYKSPRRCHTWRLEG